MYLLLAFGTAARPKAILDLTSFQVDCDARLIRLNPPGRPQNKKRRPTLPICDTFLPYLRALPAGPVVQYNGRALRGVKSTFDHLTERAAHRVPAISDVMPYVIRHTIAAEIRKRGVPVWEVAGFLGHTSGYKRTERYAKFGPDHLARAVRAIDAYFADLQALGARLQLPQPVLRVSSVLASPANFRKPLSLLVEPTGIEPVTSTMPL